MNKVLIAAPIGDGKEYSINEWLQWIADQPYKNYDVVLCVNGKTPENIEKKCSMLKECLINDRPITILKLPYDQYHTTKHRLAYSREKIREYAINGGYDYLLWLDTDTIPFIMDAIQLLINQEKEVISGLYFYKGTKQSVIVDDSTLTNVSYERITKLVETGEVVKVWGFGFGIVLMARSVFDKFSFDYRYKYEDWSEDFIACELLEKNNVERWFYARIICKHYHSKDFTIGDSSCSQQEATNEGSIREDQHLSASKDRS